MAEKRKKLALVYSSNIEFLGAFKSALEGKFEALSCSRNFPLLEFLLSCDRFCCVVLSNSDFEKISARIDVKKFCKKTVFVRIDKDDLQIGKWRQENADALALSKIDFEPVFLDLEETAREYFSPSRVSSIGNSKMLQKLYDFLMLRKNEIVSIHQIAMELWGNIDEKHDNSIYNYIHFLRRRLRSQNSCFALLREKKRCYRLIEKPATAAKKA